MTGAINCKPAVSESAPPLLAGRRAPPACFASGASWWAPGSRRAPSLGPKLFSSSASQPQASTAHRPLIDARQSSSSPPRRPSRRGSPFPFPLPQVVRGRADPSQPYASLGAPQLPARPVLPLPLLREARGSAMALPSRPLLPTPPPSGTLTYRLNVLTPREQHTAAPLAAATAATAPATASATRKRPVSRPLPVLLGAASARAAVVPTPTASA